MVDFANLPTLECPVSVTNRGFLPLLCSLHVLPCKYVFLHASFMDVSISFGFHGVPHTVLDLDFFSVSWQVRAGSAAIRHAEGAGEEHRLQPYVGTEGAWSTVRRGRAPASVPQQELGQRVRAVTGRAQPRQQHTEAHVAPTAGRQLSAELTGTGKQSTHTSDDDVQA